MTSRALSAGGHAPTYASATPRGDGDDWMIDVVVWRRQEAVDHLSRCSTSRTWSFMKKQSSP